MDSRGARHLVLLVELGATARECLQHIQIPLPRGNMNCGDLVCAGRGGEVRICAAVEEGDDGIESSRTGRLGREVDGGKALLGPALDQRETLVFGQSGYVLVLARLGVAGEELDGKVTSRPRGPVHRRLLDSVAGGGGPARRGGGPVIPQQHLKGARRRLAHGRVVPESPSLGIRRVQPLGVDLQQALEVLFVGVDGGAVRGAEADGGVAGFFDCADRPRLGRLVRSKCFVQGVDVLEVQTYAAVSLPLKYGIS
mmetsp:Transcript_37419/g.69179  ORF Transcript_37419/g.69179 Transcript_37419/m.69179 type:complete len:254 (+) Transcript_37419:8519-9280(+)